MDISIDGVFFSDLRRTLQNCSRSEVLAASARRAISESRELHQLVLKRRSHPDFLSHTVKYAPMFPRMRRFLPFAGGGTDPLRIETEERPEGMVAHVSGEVDLANVDRLKAALQPALNNCRNVILDISKLRYIDSTGLHVFIDANKILQDNNCQLAVVGASPAIAKVMRILHLDTIMPLLSSVEEAVTLLGANASEAASDG